MYLKPRSLRSKALCALTFLAVVASSASILRGVKSPVQIPLFEHNGERLGSDLEELDNVLSSSHQYTTHRQMRVNETQWAMTYVPYTAAGDCKTSREIARDAHKIADAGFTSLRLYSTDCSILGALETTLRKRHLGLAVGIHVGEDFPQAAADQLGDLVEYGAWDTVELVMLGNEAIWSGAIGASVMSDFLRGARKLLLKVGYDGPITAVEPLEVWDSFADVLCPAVDVVGANIQPYFDGSVEAKDAGLHVQAQLTRLDGVCKGKPVPAINLETGWPSRGSTNRKARASTGEQAIALRSILQTSGSRSAAHGFEDDLWKEVDDLGVERHFGCLDTLVDMTANS